MSAGVLYGVGLGPGDPELVTVKAARLIAAAEVIAYHSARHGRSIARSIAQPYLSGDQIEERLTYPVTTEASDHPGGYRAAMEEFYADAAARLIAHLDAGRDVVLLAEGDPLFYSSYMHMHKRISPRYRTEIVPGITSVSAASAALGAPLVEGNDVLSVVPATLGEAGLTARLGGGDAVAIMKLSRSYAAVRAALQASGRLADAWYVQRASATEQRCLPAVEVDPERVPYMSLVLVPGAQAATAAAASDGSAAAGTATAAATGRVDVVGLGPGAPGWVTPEVSAVLAAADDLVGYRPYLDRVSAGPRQRKHASDNRVEAQRAEFALELARRGRRVAVVSSGDPGVFAMATAVIEAADGAARFADVQIAVLPGLTAAQAVASQAGAPLGHDFAVISLSDRLKPWSMVAERLAAAARADLVIAIYNPASKARREQLHAARAVLRQHRSDTTPVIIGRAVGTAEQTITVTTLAELDPESVDMRCLLIIGSSQTRVASGGNGVPRVYTPRRYPG